MIGRAGTHLRPRCSLDRAHRLGTSKNLDTPPDLQPGENRIALSLFLSVSNLLCPSLSLSLLFPANLRYLPSFKDENDVRGFASRSSDLSRCSAHRSAHEPTHAIWRDYASRISGVFSYRNPRSLVLNNKKEMRQLGALLAPPLLYACSLAHVHQSIHPSTLHHQARQHVTPNLRSNTDQSRPYVSWG